MTCFRLLHENYNSVSNIAARSVSSEEALYPLSNLDDIYRRSKVWRTAGYFKIESGSNTIVFRESVGVDLIATIPADEYESKDDFALAIKNALDAAGASTYSVSIGNNTKRFIITSDGSGGGGIFQLMWASSTAMAEIIGFAAINITGALSYEADVIRNHTEEFILWDMGVPVNPTDFCFVGFRNDVLKVSPSATLKLQGSDTNNWASPQYEVSLNYDDRVIYQHNSSGLDTSPHRYWRFSIVDKENLNGYVEFSLGFIGLSKNLDRGSVQFPFQVQSLDPSEILYSEGGQSFATKRQKTIRVNIEWNALTKEDFQELFEIFELKGLTEPFFMSADPQAVFSTAKEYWVRWVKFEQDIQADLVSPNNYTMRMVLREQI